jgi:predicted Fe-Mo cluster-binding NifX family protein
MRGLQKRKDGNIKMKIALPIDEKDLNNQVSVSFGRAPYYAVYDTETKEIIEKDGGKAECYRLDVTDKENVADVMAKVYKKYGRLDILVSNAGNLSEPAFIKTFTAGSAKTAVNPRTKPTGIKIQLNERLPKTTPIFSPKGRNPIKTP